MILKVSLVQWDHRDENKTSGLEGEIMKLFFAAAWSAYAKATLLEEIGGIRSRQGDDRAMEELYRIDSSFRVHR
jgi:hypothetical protein